MGEYHQLLAKPKPESLLVQSLWSLVILMFFLVPGYSSPLPAPPDTLTEADYSVTILTSPINGLGYEAYALTLSHFIHFYFPGWRIRVVIEDFSGRSRQQAENDKTLFYGSSGISVGRNDKN